MNPFVFNENGSLGKNGKENGKKIQRKSKWTTRIIKWKNLGKFD